MTELAFYRGKRVLVTGHTGFKGTWLCRILLRAGAEVIGYALPPPTEPSLCALTGTEREMRSIRGDIRDREALIKATQEAEPDIVFHLAAQPLVRRSYIDPALTYETNVMGTVNMLEAVRGTPSVRSVVNVTTDKVYENREWCWGYRENENLCGFDPYSNSKSCSELVTCSYRSSFFASPDEPAISTARSGNVIGGGDFAEDRIIPDCIRAATEGRPIIVRNPHSVRPYQHVLECLSGYLLLAERQYAERSLAGAYNFGPGVEGCVTTGDLVTLFCEAWKGSSWTAKEANSGPHEANFLKLDCSKAKSVLAWIPKWDICTAVEKTVEFVKGSSDSTAAIAVDTQVSNYFD